MQHTTSRIVMVRPAAFGCNEETLSNNYFQQKAMMEKPDLQRSALKLFDAWVELLRQNDVEVFVLNDNAEPAKPDALFPNNWICTTKNEIIIFPMYAQNRRAEKRPELVEQIKSIAGIDRVTDYSNYENKNQFLEGTGSLVLDRVHKIAYACRSERSHPELVQLFAREHDFLPIIFTAKDAGGRDIYHTNVMMNIGKSFAVVCFDAIPAVAEKQMLRQSMEQNGLEIIPISISQMNMFAGNMLQIHNKNSENLLVMSSTAFHALTPPQITTLEKYARIVHADTAAIEQASGGSIRCMMAEVFSV